MAQVVRAALGVGEAAGVQRQHAVAGPGLDRERVVVAVAAVAERPAVEDQVVRTRALDEVAAVLEARGLGRPAVQLGREQPRGQLQQHRVVTGVAVRQRRNRPVPGAACAARSRREREPLVEAARQLDVVATAVLACADERAQGDHVVVRAALAVHAVGAEVGQQVLVQLARGQLEQARLEVRECERGDQQRVELERAVVALGGEVVADVAGLLAQALHQPRDARLRQPLPGVDPVQDPPRGDVAGVVVGRYLEDEGGDEPLPRLQVPAVACRPEGVRKVEPVIELHPVDPPLLVLRQLGAQPVRLHAQLAGLPGKAEDPARDRVRQLAVAMLVLVDAEHGAGTDGGQHSTSRNSRASSCAERSPSKWVATVSRARSVNRRVSSGSSSGASARRRAPPGPRARRAGR